MFTYDFNTAPQLSQVRMMIADTDITHPIFDDDEVNNALYLESSQGLFVSGQAVPTAVSYAPSIPIVYSVRRAAALLLDCIASNKAKLAALSELLDVHLQPEKAAQELRAQAKALRDTEANMGNFAIAEMGDGAFWERERIYKQLLRLYGNS